MLIDLRREERLSSTAWFNGLTDHPAVSDIAAGEFLFGAQSRKEVADVKGFLKPFPVLWPATSDLQRALTFAEYKLSDGFGLLDAITASIALRHNLTLVTFNVKHFRALPNLKTVQPYTR